MILRSIRLILISAFIVGLSSHHAIALKYMGKDHTGARYYHCGFSCGKFKVIRKAKNRYRVYSIYFSGEVNADSFEDAAQVACEESDKSLNKLIDPLPSRGNSSC